MRRLRSQSGIYGAAAREVPLAVKRYARRLGTAQVPRWGYTVYFIGGCPKVPLIRKTRGSSLKLRIAAGGVGP